MKPRNFDRNNVIRNTEKLPVGGYVVKILDAKEQNFTWGDVLVISFDIAEGDFKDFFDENYKAQQGEDKKWKGTFRLNIPKEDGSEQDQWTQKKFNTNIVAIEDSNPNYFFDWDEAKLKGKLVGAIFNNKEYEVNGNHGFYTNCYSFVSVETIRSGNFKIPADTLLRSNTGSATSNTTVSTDFVNVSGGDEEIPFN